MSEFDLRGFCGPSDLSIKGGVVGVEFEGGGGVIAAFGFVAVASGRQDGEALVVDEAVGVLLEDFGVERPDALEERVGGFGFVEGVELGDKF